MDTQGETRNTEDAVFRGVMRAVIVTALAAALLVGVVWFAVGLASSNDDLECATRNAERAVEGLPDEDC